MIKRQHATFQHSLLFSFLLQRPHVHPLKPRQAFPATSGYTRVIPVLWQNSLPPPNLNSLSWAHRVKRQIQYKPQVISHAGLPAQVRARQDMNTVPRKSRAILGTCLAPEQWQGTRNNVWGLPSGCPSQLSCISDPDCPGRVWFVARVSGRSPGTSSAVLPDPCPTTAA